MRTTNRTTRFAPRLGVAPFRLALYRDRARHVRALLADPSYAEHAKAVGQAIAHEHGIQRACEVILDRASSARAEMA
jgi:hypothetical protein